MQHSLGSENNVFLYDNLFMLIISTSIKMRPWLQLLHNGVCMQLYQNLIYYTNSKEQFLEQYDNSKCYLSYQIILLRKKHKHLLELYEMLNLSSAKSIYLWTTAWSLTIFCVKLCPYIVLSRSSTHILIPIPSTFLL